MPRLPLRLLGPSPRLLRLVILVHKVILVVAQVVVANADLADGMGDGLLRGRLELDEEVLEGSLLLLVVDDLTVLQKRHCVVIVVVVAGGGSVEWEWR